MSDVGAVSAGSPASGEPRVERPTTEPGYGIPESLDGALSWSWARERLEQAAVYWVATTRPDGRPLAMPTWGTWVDGAFWMEGGDRTRPARNLASNPAAVVHIERGDDVVIVEGTAERVLDPADALVGRPLAGFQNDRATHGYDADPANWQDGGLWRVRPALAFGWSSYPTDAARWRFAAEPGT